MARRLVTECRTSPSEDPDRANKNPNRPSKCRCTQPVGVNNRRSKKEFHHPDRMTHCLRFIFRSMLNSTPQSDFFGCHWQSSLVADGKTTNYRREAWSNYSVDGRFNCHQIVIDEISFDSETESFEIELRRRQRKAWFSFSNTGFGWPSLAEALEIW